MTKSVAAQKLVNTKQVRTKETDSRSSGRRVVTGVRLDERPVQDHRKHNGDKEYPLRGRCRGVE